MHTLIFLLKPFIQKAISFHYKLIETLKLCIMYIVINKTKRKDFQFTGGWPSSIIEYMLDNGDDIIVISTYSNSLKIPAGFSTKYEGEREWKEYTYHPDMFKERE